ncbi:LysM peptidoglycan-binding domain-containing protein [Paludifilum halophilum]|uniref:LysM peptidoglycan-binding domain-containing protein n=1 Tax=Paludifilum halophilum TaxID=1642702 RepID=UPI00146F4806|nr:LysM domain-containing protein [Paludifilum halophilum]
MKLHVVQSGDTLWKIAQRYDISLQKLMDANPHIEDAECMKDGLKVRIPTGKVKVSETKQEEAFAMGESPDSPQMEGISDPGPFEEDLSRESSQEDREWPDPYSPMMPPMPEAPRYPETPMSPMPGVPQYPETPMPPMFQGPEYGPGMPMPPMPGYAPGPPGGIPPSEMYPPGMPGMPMIPGYEAFMPMMPGYGGAFFPMMPAPGGFSNPCGPCGSDGYDPGSAEQPTGGGGFYSPGSPVNQPIPGGYGMDIQPEPNSPVSDPGDSQGTKPPSSSLPPMPAFEDEESSSAED